MKAAHILIATILLLALASPTLTLVEWRMPGGTPQHRAMIDAADARGCLRADKLQPRWIYEPDSAAVGVAAADLDSDGVGEVVVALSSGEVVAIAGDSLGSAEILWSQSTDSQLALAPVIGDVNHFYKGLEIAICDILGTIYLLNSTGSRVWTRGVGAISYDLNLIDANGDGYEEVVAAADSVVVLFDENGTEIGAYDLGQTVLGAPAVGDIDRDGAPEIVVGVAGAKVVVLSGSPTVPEAEASVSGGAYGAAIGMLVSKLTREAVVYAPGTPSQLIIVQRTADAFQEEATVSLPEEPITYPVVAELDGDGLDEVLLVTSSKLLTYDYEEGLKEVASLGGTGITPAMVADTDADGVYEIIVGTTEGVFCYEQTGELAWSYSITDLGGVAIADVDGDHALEVVVAGAQVVCLDADDQTPPAVTIVSPANWSAQGEIAVVNWSVEDNIWLSDITVLLNKTTAYGPVAVDSRSSKGGAEIALEQEGVYALTVRATDYAGNVGEATIWIIADKTGPTITIVRPEPGSWTTSPVNVQWIASDQSNVSAVEIYVDGGREPVAQLAGNETSYTVSINETGYHTIRIVAYDGVGNVGEVEVGFNVDLSPPVLHLTHPVNGTKVGVYAEQADLTVMWWVEDEGSGYAYAELVLDGGDVVTTNATSYTFESVSTGAHNLTITVYDGVGHSTTAFVEFELVLEEVPQPPAYQPYLILLIATAVAAGAVAAGLGFFWLVKRQR